MKHHVEVPGDDFRHVVLVGHIRLHERHAVGNTVAGPFREVVDNASRRSIGEAFGEVGTDQPGTAGYENPFS